MSRDAFVIGITGQVGGALREALGAERAWGTCRAHPDAQTPFLDLEPLATDASPARALLAEARPRWLFIAAGWTWVDGCEDDPDKAMRINRDAPAVLAEAAHAVGARTVYYSTEYVFDGTAGPYGEEDPVEPLSVYARSKLEGEQAVLAADPDALILRTTVVYGPERQGKNFAYRLVETLRRGESIRVPTDQISSPTYNRDLATASVALAEQGARGIYNVTGAEVMDRLEFSQRLVRFVGGLDEGLIEPVTTAAFAQKANRPLRAGMKVDKLLAALPELRLRTVEEALADWRDRPHGKAWPGKG